MNMQKKEASKRIVVKNAEALAILGVDKPYLKDGYVLIKDGIIEEIGTGTPPQSAEIEIDAAGKLVLPGFVNAHHHLYQTLNRAYPPALNISSYDWLKMFYPLWGSTLDEEAVYLGALIGMAELMLSGCTTTVDHHFVFTSNLTNAIDVEIEAAKKIGIRFEPCRGSMDLSEEEGGLPCASTTQSVEEIIRDSERLITKYHDRSFGAMIRISLGPCSLPGVTPALMKETANLARRLGVRLHTHLGGVPGERRLCQERFGLDPLDYAEEMGWLERDVWIAHGIHFQDSEIARLARAGVAIAHCPNSNMRLGDGIAPIVALRKHGVPVGLGVDGSASNDASNMLLEIRQALLLQRAVHGPSALTVRDVLWMATCGGARCLGREDVGTLRKGKVADLAIFNLDELNYSGAGDPLGTLVLCAPTVVETLIIGGKIVVEDHQIQTIDIKEAKGKHKEKAKKIIAGCPKSLVGR